MDYNYFVKRLAVSIRPVNCIVVVVAGGGWGEDDSGLDVLDSPSAGHGVKRDFLKTLAFMRMCYSKCVTFHRPTTVPVYSCRTRT